MRYRTKQEVIEYVQQSERVGEAMADLIDALETNTRPGVAQAKLFDVIDEERDFARNEVLEDYAS